MKQMETFSTPVELVAAYLLAKGLKMERIEIISAKKYFPDCCFHFPKKEAERLLYHQERMVNFTKLKTEHDLLAMKAVKARDEFSKQGGRS